MLTTRSNESPFGLFNKVEILQGVILILHSIVMMEDYDNCELITFLLRQVVSKKDALDRYSKA